MKTRTLLSILILVLAVLIVAGSCATKQKAISEEDFYMSWTGTWVNTEQNETRYNVSFRTEKIINHPNGASDRFLLADERRSCIHQYTLSESWKDSKGNIWYRATATCPRLQNATLSEYGKISNSNNTLELIYYVGADVIEEWEPDSPKYFHLIFDRQE